MNWGSREECHCPSTAWGGTNFWANWYTKKQSIRCQNSRSKTSFIVFQNKSLFNLFKDVFKWIEGLGRSATVWVQSEAERIFEIGGIQKKYSIHCQISRSKKRNIVFQDKSLFNLFKDLFKWIEGLGRSVTVRVQCEGELIFELGGIQKSTRYVVKFIAQKRAIKRFNINRFQPSQRLIQMKWGSREECHCPSTVWEGKIFWPRWYTKTVLDTLSNFALKNALYSVST